MLRSRAMELAGWGNLPVERCLVYRPERLAELRELVSSVPEKTILPRGLGRSYGDAALNREGGIVLQERLDRMLGFEPQSGVLECEGGVSVEDILEVFLPRGFFPPVTPGTKFVTVGGAIAADVHGKNHHRDGCISAFVEDFKLLKADGQVINCSRRENAEAFWATIGGMGLTGIITSARLRLLRVPSAYVAVDYHKTANLDATLESFSSGDSGYQYSVAWIDCLASGASLGRSVVMRGNHATLEQLPDECKSSPLVPPARRNKNMPVFMPGWVLSGPTVRAFNAMFYRRHKDGRRIVEYDEFFYPLDSIAHWNRMYGKRGFVQYQAVLPHEQSRGGLVRMLEMLSISGGASFLAVLKTFGAEGGGLLSFPRAGQTLAIDLPNTGQSLRELLARLDEIVLECGGRVYLAKDACLSRTCFEQMYPRAGQFRKVRARLDPKGRFSSSLARRLGIIPEA